MKTIEITVKQGRDIDLYTRKNVKFYQFEKQYLSITYEDGRHSFFRLSTVLAVEEVA